MLSIVIGGREVGELVVNQARWERSLNTLTNKGSATLKLDAEALRRLDLTGSLKLTYTEGERATVLFSGTITNAEARNDTYEILFADPGQLLEEARTGGGFGKDIHPIEIIYYLVASATPEMVRPDTIEWEQGKSLADNKMLFAPRMYTFLAPLPFVAAPGNPVEILDAIIYDPVTHPTVDDDAVQSAFTNEIPDDWKPGKARVRYVIQAEGFLDAFDRGRERLRRTLDFLSMAANYSSPTIPTNGDLKFVEFDRTNLNSPIADPTWAFVRDNYPGKLNRFWLRWYSPHLGPAPLELNAVAGLPLFSEAYASFLTRSKGTLSSRQRSMLSAIHALRRARQAAFEQDALSLLWQAIEYLAAGHPATPPISQETQKALLDLCLAKLSELVDPTQVDTDWVSKHVRRGLNQVRSLPIRDKWDRLCVDLGIEFTKEETDQLWALRTLRNNDLHGKEVTVARQDVFHGLVMVEKVVVALLAKESGK